jgi:hypothetical protein
LLWVMTAACLVLALGPAAGVYAVLLKIFPPAGFMRYPIKFVMLPVMLGPLLAALAARTYLEGSPDIKRRFWRDGLVLGTSFLILIGLAVGFARSHPVLDEEWTTTAMNGLTRAAFLAGALGIWYAVGRIASARWQLLSRLALVILMWLDVSTHAPRQNPSVEREVFLPSFSPLAELTPRPVPGQSRAMLSLQAILEHRTKILTNAAAGYLLKRLGLYGNANLVEEIPKVDGFFALEFREERDVRHELYPTTNSYRAPLADFLSVSQVTSASNLFVWTPRLDCLPMATAGQQAVFLDRSNTLAALTDPRFNPRTTVFLMPEDKKWVSVDKTSAAQITASQWASHKITLEVSNTEPALVVLSQAYYHNWHAYVDGQPAHLLRANYAFQAVEVPASRGVQQVSLVYEDRAFRAGACLSLACIALCAVLWLRRPKQAMA